MYNLMYDLSVYDEQFFINNRAEGLKHAEWFVPLLVKVFNPKTMIDVGCGTGHFVEKARLLAIDAYGIEGATRAHMGLGTAPMAWEDLRKPLPQQHPYRWGRGDLAICIEVAEHIEPEYADVFTDNLCLLSDTIVMTAAPPGQGGLQHVNEQPEEYWQMKMAACNYNYNVDRTADLAKGILRARYDGLHVATWFKNIMCYTHR